MLVTYRYTKGTALNEGDVVVFCDEQSLTLVHLRQFINRTHGYWADVYCVLSGGSLMVRQTDYKCADWRPPHWAKSYRVATCADGVGAADPSSHTERGKRNAVHHDG